MLINKEDKRKTYLSTELENGFIVYPQGKNSVSSLSVLFEDKTYYQDILIPYISNYFSDKAIFADLTQKNSLFGLVNKNLDVIIPSSFYIKNLPSGNKNKQYAMDFVAQAFVDMNKYLYNASLSRKISSESPFFNLKVYRSYLDPRVEINSIQRKIVTQFKTKIINDFEFSSKVKDAETFNKTFLQNLIELIKNNVPVTKEAIILSGNFKSFSSGLVIDISDDKADDDYKKFDKYLSKEDFLIFTEACKRFGFLIDKNVPWRIIADINSPAMLEVKGNHIGYMRRYNLQNPEDLFNKRFLPVILDELIYLKSFFYDAYNSLLRDYPFYEASHKDLQSCDFNKKTTFQRQPITYEKYLSLFPDTYWLRAFVFLRNYEEKRNLSQIEFDNIVREANHFVSYNRNQEALVFVNSYFKKFDNLGYYSRLQSSNKEVEQKVQSSLYSEIIF